MVLNKVLTLKQRTQSTTRTVLSMAEENLDRADLINRLGDLQENLEDDVERIEHYRERLRNGDEAQEILDEFIQDDGFFID